LAAASNCIKKDGFASEGKKAASRRGGRRLSQKRLGLIRSGCKEKRQVGRGKGNREGRKEEGRILSYAKGGGDETRRKGRREVIGSGGRTVFEGEGGRTKEHPPFPAAGEDGNASRGKRGIGPRKILFEGGELEQGGSSRDLKSCTSPGAKGDLSYRRGGARESKLRMRKRACPKRKSNSLYILGGAFKARKGRVDREKGPQLQEKNGKRTA